MAAINRVWAMPNASTFSVPPIADVLRVWLSGRSVIVDPFARNSTWGTLRNDLNPETDAEFHMEAVAFCDKLIADGLIADAVLFDPPYSPRQISECYQLVGQKRGTKTTQNARLYREVRDRLDKILCVNGIAISCGWNSCGFGESRKYRTEEIMIVAHGGAHNDTIIVVETKQAPGPIQEQLYV